ncbi:hypothetical protein PAESOLCIP111_06173 [Paenibacillus solanacearum]|uniref:Extracellular solute-binding protein n=1 Tax=Paenibacillus solanacearum TaxID=2048548 RepID=A0A916K7T1_9BACL|nr:extracellular solute-binding protein [Paenibacillus solanacearum]CAG7650776.1 hypothetical protein PAESOLCIP111_06173 [Paenibacillus solanacearum]
MKKSIVIASLSMMVAVTGCSTKTAEQPTAEVQPEKFEPVTLTLYQSGNYLSEADFKTLITDPVKKKYPHITVENHVSKSDLPDLIAAGESVDFFVTYNGNMSKYLDLDVYSDITPLAKKLNFDLGKFEPRALDAIRSISDKKELYALPYSNNLNALYYNKDIFDKFGIPYPKDGMTWGDTIELAKKVTRTDNGTKFHGLEVDSVSRLTFPLSLVHVEPGTNKVLINSEPYKQAFETGRDIFSIPGNEYINGGAASWNRFIKDMTVAMEATVNLFLRFPENPDLKWDVVQFPSYKDKPNTFGMDDLHIAIPIKTSKHKDDQIRVMEVLFSDEVQSIMVKQTARVSVLKDAKYVQMFGQDIPELKGKNIPGIFKSKPAPTPVFSKHQPKAQSILNTEFENVIKGKKDVNTALRDAEELTKNYLLTEAAK